MRDTRERVLDILEAIERIEKYASRGREEFDRDELLQVWVLHHLQILGEATAAMPAIVRDRAPEIPWNKIVGMRNILVHQYFGIDREAVWSVVEKDLPQLRPQVEDLLAKLEGQD